jgi:hypothetical protein
MLLVLHRIVSAKNSLFASAGRDSLVGAIGPGRTHAKLKRAAPKSWPDHGGTIPAQCRIHMSSREGMAPYDKAWRTLAIASYPCILQCVSHGFLSLHTTFTARFDAQDLPCLIVFACFYLHLQ